MTYNKYKESGAIHWDWYKNKLSYKQVVDSALAQFDETDTGLGAGVVLDVGAGDGLPAYLLTQKGFVVEGVDSNIQGKKLMKEKFEENGVKPIKYYGKKVENLKPARRYDYLLSINAIEHLNKPEAIVELMEYVDNYAVIVTDDVNQTTGQEGHNREFTIDELKKLFSDYDVEEIEINHPKFIGIKVKK